MESVKKLSELSKEDLADIIEGYHRLLQGLHDLFEGVYILKEIEEKKGIPLFKEDMLNFIAELIDNPEFEVTIKKSDVESAKVLVLFMKSAIKMMKIAQSLGSVDPKTSSSSEIKKVLGEIKELVEYFEEVKKYVKGEEQ